MTTAVIGLDLAKNVFQIHGVDASERPVLKRKLRRPEVLPLLAGLPWPEPEDRTPRIRRQ